MWGLASPSHIRTSQNLVSLPLYLSLPHLALAELFFFFFSVFSEPSQAGLAPGSLHVPSPRVLFPTCLSTQLPPHPIRSLFRALFSASPFPTQSQHFPRITRGLTTTGLLTCCSCSLVLPAWSLARGRCSRIHSFLYPFIQETLISDDRGGGGH